MWTIRQHQMTALADATREEVVARIAAHIADGYPELPLELGEEGYEPWVRDLVDAAIGLKITREENLRRFVEWHAALGAEESFTEHFPWALDVLRVTAEDEALRVAAVDLRMQGRHGEER